MAGLFVKGETKYRAGVYRRHEQIETETIASAMNGVFCIPVHAQFGPLGEVKAVTTKSELYQIYQSSGTVDAAAKLFEMGATKVYVCRLGTGGAQASLVLKNSSSANAVTLKTLYATDLSISVTIKTKLGDSTAKECSIYNGTTLLEKLTFTAGDDEIDNLVAAIADSNVLTAEKASGATGTLADVSQQALSGGTAPTVATSDYSTAFNLFEVYNWNVLVLDTVDDDVKALAKAYMDRIHENGAVGICVLGESCANSISQRMTNAKSYNAPYFVYCGSGFVDVSGNTIDGYLSIAIQAGIIGSKETSTSIVHTEIPDAESVMEKLTYTQYVEAIKAGLLLLSEGPDGQVWFDSGVNTYTTLADDDDEGWKKIKRTGVRYEVFDRIDRQLAGLIGKINCDDDGVNNVIQQGKKILEAMVLEKKILDNYEFYEDTDNPHSADHANFIIKIDDIDSLEKIYLTYQFEYESA